MIFGSPAGVDQDVGRLEIAMDDALLVAVMHRVADLGEQLQPLRGDQSFSSSANSVIVPGVGDVLHDEVRHAAVTRLLLVRSRLVAPARRWGGAVGRGSAIHIQNAAEPSARPGPGA